ARDDDARPDADEKSKAVRDGAPDDAPPAKKSYREILAQEIHEASIELHRPQSGLVMSSLSAGMDVGFSLFAVAVMVSLLGGEIDGLPGRLLVSAVYPIGYIFVVIGRSELFTEHTTLAVLPVLNRDARLSRLLRLWVTVYLGNLVGVTLFALFAATLGPELGAFHVDDLEHVARGIVDHDGWIIGLSAVLAGWLMGLLSWLVTAARETIAQIAIVFMITGLIGLGHLHHCIVGACEVFTALIAGADVTVSEAARFLGWATLGNAVGGVLFVGVVKYGHASRAAREG
ncbi:MAG: formate/nitrite transporter family protein, partial [Myxococcales bacterium]|nr:formate/nitrite transporter family protein [Myxococcales bacterium]